MRIYIAGFCVGNKSGTPNVMISQSANPKYNLESYHYMTAPKAKQLRADGRTVFLDSGAFSMFTQGIEVDLGAYAQFIKDNADIIHVSSNLDVIGQGNEEASYKNQKILEGFGATICPVHHARDTDKWLQRYMAEGYDYIFLGGMVPETRQYLKEWLDHVWSKYLTDADGMPKIKVHGFGLTSLELMERYPWFSVDSTNWSVWARLGMIHLDLSHKHISLLISQQSSSRRDIDSWHFANLRPDEQQIVESRFAELDMTRSRDLQIESIVEAATGIPQGYNKAALSEMTGWRDHINIDFFNRLCTDQIKPFIADQPKLFT